MLTVKELEKIKADKEALVNFRRENAGEPGKDAAKGGYKKQVLICGGTGCQSSGCKMVVEALQKAITELGLEKDVLLVQTGCFGLCALGPIMIVYPEGSFYSQVNPKAIREIAESHLKNGKVVKHLLYQETVRPDGTVSSLYETNFYKKQLRLALRNCGVIDPENIEEYIATGGYGALARVLTSMKPNDVIQTLDKAGLRGRGGGGFPTGRKWDFAKASPGDEKYVCCNADEGDPGAFMDRSILEGDPHSVIEAMTIAGYTIGAHQGYVYIRAEYPVAVQRLRIALEQARKLGVLGENIFETDFSFDIEIRLGAGAFVCGEETALLTSIEGHRGEPRPRPPFPAVEGLFGKPTIVNNVETYANIPQIILRGWEWFAGIGTKGSHGTKVFALGGKITNVGLVEIPMGTTLREIVEEIGGGIPNGKKFKAAQTGGPSGGCIPALHIDTKIDYESLTELGSMMGSGGLIILDEDSCMVDIAKFFLEFTVEESCGKCTPCRLGTRRLHQLLDKIASGNGKPHDLGKIAELCDHMRSTSLCALGQTASNPVASTMKFFRDEYIQHVYDKSCPAGVCKGLLSYKIIAVRCKGCTLCMKNCPVDAIRGAVKQPHAIDRGKCIKCGLCMKQCKFDAIIKQ